MSLPNSYHQAISAKRRAERIGIPYAPTEVTATGLIHTCPVCGEKCIDPIESFDEYGEQTAPSAYQNHYAEAHAEDAEQDDAYERASADFVIPVNEAEMARLKHALTVARDRAEMRSWSRQSAVAFNDLLARLRQIEGAR